MRQLAVKRILKDFESGNDELGVEGIIFPKDLSDVFKREIEHEGELSSQEVAWFLESCTDENLLDILDSQACFRYR